MTTVTAVVMDWAEYHFILAPSAVMIALVMIGVFVAVKYPFTKPLPENKVLDERPWKDPQEEQ